MSWKIVWKVCNKLDYFLTCIYPNMYNNTTTCHISDIKISACRISRTKRAISNSISDPFHGRCKMESRSDTNVTGKNWVILKYNNRGCDVAPFSNKYTPMNYVPIVSAATGCTSSNGRRYILVFNEALCMEDMEHTFVNPNQCRHFGAEVQDNPYDQKNLMKITSPDEEFVAWLQS